MCEFEEIVLHFKACCVFQFLRMLNIKYLHDLTQALYLHSALPSLLQLNTDRKVLYPKDVLTLSYDTSSLPPSAPAKL